MQTSGIPQNLNSLREFMISKKLDAFIIPSTDPHLSEYPTNHWETRRWISGFDGSAGTVVVTLDKAGLWTDSRYFLQGEQQLKGSTIFLFKEGLPETPSITEWLTRELVTGQTVGIDANVYIAKEAQLLKAQLKNHGIELNDCFDPFTLIWKNRPIIPENPIFAFPEEYSGESVTSKVGRIREILRKEHVDSIIVPTLDTIAWIFNIRGNDVKCNPVAVSFAYISLEKCILFINPKKVTTDVQKFLHEQNVTLAEYSVFYDFVGKLNEHICIDSNKITQKIFTEISENTIIDIPSPIDLMKSKKNETELQGFRKAMIRDGVAMVQFLIWLETSSEKREYIDELMISDKLKELRDKQKLYVGESFDTIAGYGSNGAIVHYHATKASSKKLENQGFLLVDSGAQYFDGTTDLTRTIALGRPSDQMKEDYTRVLKGHIQIASAIYPKGTRGSQIDILARKALWDKGLNYLHGTGHGVGHFLNVHEGPQNIRMNENSTTLEIGMVTSNEPGLYREGEYGIRLENLVTTQKELDTEFGEFYSFETLTLCPFDSSCINKELLSDTEIEWYNNYHKTIYKRLSDFLSEAENEWLKNKTHEI